MASSYEYGPSQAGLHRLQEDLIRAGRFERFVDLLEGAEPNKLHDEPLLVGSQNAVPLFIEFVYVIDVAAGLLRILNTLVTSEQCTEDDRAHFEIEHHRLDGGEPNWSTFGDNSVDLARSRALQIANVIERFGADPQTARLTEDPNPLLQVELTRVFGEFKLAQLKKLAATKTKP